MYVKDVKKDLKEFKDWEVILNLTKEGTWTHTYDTVETFLNKYDDNVDFPFAVIDIIYDWDEIGEGDGHKVICFYTDAPSQGESNSKFQRAYKVTHEYIK